MRFNELLKTEAAPQARRGRKPAMAHAHLRKLRYLVACRVLINGETRAQLARELGLNPRTIYTWIRQVLCDERPPDPAFKRSVRSRKPQKAGTGTGPPESTQA